MDNEGTTRRSRKPVRYQALVPGLLNGRQHFVHNNTRDNLTRAVLERVFFVKRDGEFLPPLQPRNDSIFDQRCGDFRLMLVNALKPTPVVSFQEFPGLYHGRKKGVYERAVNQLLRIRSCAKVGENPFREPAQKWAAGSIFVKSEKIVGKDDSAPRIITPRHPCYNVLIGVYLKNFEKALFKKVSRVFPGVYVAKGLNAESCGSVIAKEWSKYKDPIAISLDAERFDQHVSQTALRFEHSIYNRVFRSEWLAWLLTLQLVTTASAMYSDGTVSFKKKGGRCSGDMNTGLGNCILMCAMIWSYFDQIHVPFSLINNGDDCVVIIERSHEPETASLQGWFAEMGFSMKREATVDVLEHIEFCQAHPIRTSLDRTVMVRNPDVTMVKDNLSQLPCETIEQWNFARKAIGDCQMALHSDIPIMSAYAACMLRGVPSTTKSRNTKEFTCGMHYLADGMQSGNVVTDLARVSFGLAFGYCPARQVEIEEQLRNVVPRYSPTDSREISRIITTRSF